MNEALEKAYWEDRRTYWIKIIKAMHVRDYFRRKALERIDWELENNK